MKKAAKILLIMTTLAVVAMWSAMMLLRLFPMRYEEQIESCAKEYKVSKYLILGVIYAESGFNEAADSGIATGLMQLTGETADWVKNQLGISEKAEKASANIQMGTYYLSYLIERYKNVDTSLAAYNAGMGNVDKWLKAAEYSEDGKTLKKIPYGETERYVKRVRIFSYIYRKLYGQKINLQTVQKFMLQFSGKSGIVL